MKKILPAVFLICGVFLFYWLKVSGPGLVETAYQNGQFEFLNQLAKIERRESLDFYQGRIQEAFFGPVTQLISGLLFTAAALLFLQNANRLQFALAVFAYLLLTKSEVLFFPPYGDAIGGCFAEGIWLAKNSFNYLGLLKEDSYSLGGPRVYLFSIFPTYLAVMMTLIPSVKMFLAVNHLLFFGMAAMTVSLLRDCFLKVFPKDIAALGALALLFLPLFQSQTEAINMEMPSTFLMVWSAVALIERRIGKAVFFAVMATAVKGTGVLACFAVVAVMGVELLTSREARKKIRYWVYLLLMPAFGLLAVALKFLVKDQHVSGGMIHLAAGWPSLRNEFIFYLFVVCALIFLVALIRKKSGRLDAPSVMFIYAAMWFLLFFNFFAVSPRYRLALYPFLVFIVVYTAFLLLRQPALRRVGLIAVMTVSLYFSYGAFYGGASENDHVLLERSLEYRNDLKVNRRLAQRLEEHYADHLIVAPLVVAQFLALPELGYVSKKLDVMLYGFRCTYGGIKNYAGLKNLNPARTIYVGVKVAPLSPDFPYPIGPHDQILEEIQIGNKKNWLFKGGAAIDAVWRATQILKLKAQAEAGTWR